MSCLHTFFLWPHVCKECDLLPRLLYVTILANILLFSTSDISRLTTHSLIAKPMPSRLGFGSSILLGYEFIFSHQMTLQIPVSRKYWVMWLIYEEKEAHRVYVISQIYIIYLVNCKGLHHNAHLSIFLPGGLWILLGNYLGNCGSPSLQFQSGVWL